MRDASPVSGPLSGARLAGMMDLARQVDSICGVVARFYTYEPIFTDEERSEELLSRWLQISTVPLARANGDTYSIVLPQDRPDRLVQLHSTLRLIPMPLLMHLGQEFNRLGLYRPDDPLMQFYRHVRNALAHGNTITLARDEPRYPAVWREYSITRDLQGRRLLYDFLLRGDVLMLLHDLRFRFADVLGRQFLGESWMERVRPERVNDED